MQKKSLKNIKMPNKPGVYFFKKGKDVLYIGKATSLRDRVKSYFSKDLIETRGQFLVDMVFLADKIDWQTTDTVLEALILEANLIKKHQPKYNTREKDDKSFNYVCVTKEEIPKVILVRGKELKGTAGQKLLPDYVKVFGPFPNGGQLKEALKIIRRIFPFLDEKSKNYVEFYRQINLIPDLNDRKLYKQNIKNVILFFLGKKKKVLKNLEKEMKEYAKMREFEKAGEIKRQIFALKHINDVALIKGQKNFLETASSEAKGQGTPMFLKNPPVLFRVEAYDIAHMSGRNMVGVMTVVENGEIEKSEYRKFKIRTQEGANDTGALLEVLERRFSHTEWQMPVLIVVDGSTAQINTVKKFSKKVGIMVPIVAVTKDKKHRPINILGDKKLIQKHEQEILLANAEAHRFAIAYHKKLRRKNFLK